MRGLKTLVGAMTALIVGGIGLLGWGLAARAGDATRLKDAAVTLPPRAEIRAMSAYEGGVAIYTSEPKGESVYLFNSGTGKTLRVAIRRAP